MPRYGHSALDPPGYLIDRWYHWLKAGGSVGSLEEMEQQYLEAKGYGNWPEYLRHIGIDGNIHEQKRKFWVHISQTFPARVSFRHRVIYYLTTTRFGVWFIQKYLGMKGRIAA